MLEKCEWEHGSLRKGTDPAQVDGAVQVCELFPVVGMPKLSHMVTENLTKQMGAGGRKESRQEGKGIPGSGHGIRTTEAEKSVMCMVNVRQIGVSGP